MAAPPGPTGWAPANGHFTAEGLGLSQLSPESEPWGADPRGRAHAHVFVRVCGSLLSVELEGYRVKWP